MRAHVMSPGFCPDPSGSLSNEVNLSTGTRYNNVCAQVAVRGAPSPHRSARRSRRLAPASHPAALCPQTATSPPASHSQRRSSRPRTHHGQPPVSWLPCHVQTGRPRPIALAGLCLTKFVQITHTAPVALSVGRGDRSQAPRRSPTSAMLGRRTARCSMHADTRSATPAEHSSGTLGRQTGMHVAARPPSHSQSRCQCGGSLLMAGGKARCWRTGGQLWLLRRLLCHVRLAVRADVRTWY